MVNAGAGKAAAAPTRQRRPVRRHHGPMTLRELRAWAKRLAATAAAIRAQHGECQPTALVVVNGLPFSLDVVLQSEEDKQSLRLLFEVAARGGAEACALVAEGWRFGGDEHKLTRASQHALRGGSLATLRGRQEILFVHAMSACGEDLRVFEVTKRGSLRRSSRGPSASGAMSRFLTALPWRVDQRHGLRAIESSVKIKAARRS